MEFKPLWARNDSPAYKCPPYETTVQIAVHLPFFNLLATSIPAMAWDRWSHDLDDKVQINIQISASLSMDQIGSPWINGQGSLHNSRLREFEISNSTSFRALTFRNRRSADTYPVINGPTFTWVFDISNYINVPMAPSRSTVEISSGLRTSKISNLEPFSFSSNTQNLATCPLRSDDLGFIRIFTRNAQVFTTCPF